MTSQLSTVLSGADDTITAEDLGDVKEGERMVTGYICTGPGQPLQPSRYKWAPPKRHEVEVRVLCCGVCHTDIDMIENNLNLSRYPLIPGHEIVGHISQVGSDVTQLRIGQRVGIGWLSRCCGVCRHCRDGKENLCPHRETTVNRYNGGFANYVRADQKWVFSIPENLDSVSAAPLMCAGATVYSPFQEYQVRRGHTLGVIGLGGLGHIAVQMAKAKGCKVIVFSSSFEKKNRAFDLGADEFVLEEDIPFKARGLQNQLNFIMSTTTADMNWNPFLKMLQPRGVLCFVGFIPNNVSLDPKLLIAGDRKVVGSTFASIKDTQEMLRFCSRHDIHPWVEEYDISEAQNVLQEFKGKHSCRNVLKVGVRGFPEKRETM